MIISLINICANIAVTKHVLLADEFVPYRPRLLGFHSLHVNAMKCIYVGFSLSKLLSFFWKISLNSRLISLEGFNSNIATNQSVCPTWPSGKASARYIEGPGFDSRHNLFLFASFLFFSSFFTFSFRLVFILGITVLLFFFMFLLYLPFPPSPSRGPAIYVFLVLSCLDSVVADFRSTSCPPAGYLHPLLGQSVRSRVN